MINDINKIPQYYAGFKYDLDISLLNITKNGLVMITGDNGAGKTQILHYISQNYIEKNKKIIFRSPSTLNKNNRRNRFDSRSINQIENFDGIIDNIIDEIYRKLSIKLSGIEDLSSALFFNNNFYYKDRWDIINIIGDYISAKFDNSEAHSFFINIGKPRESEIKEEARNHYKKTFNVEKLHSNHDKAKFEDWYKLFINKRPFYNFIRLKDPEKAYKDEDGSWITEIKTFYPDKIEENDEEIISFITKLKNTFFHNAVNKIKYKQRNNTITIDNKQKLINHLVGLNKEIHDTDYMMQQLAQEIANDFNIKKAKDSKLNIINDILSQKDENNTIIFPYKLCEPNSSYSYQISFYINNYKNNAIYFDSLSSGEKAIFELLCYQYYVENDKNSEYILLLDEFDMNFNPTFIDKYVYIINKIKDKAKIICTTHNPITVTKIEEESLFYLDRENTKLLNGAKSTIVSKLAPGMLSFDSALDLTTIFTEKAEIIICVEGKHDKDYLEDAINKLGLNKDKYLIIQQKGSGNSFYFNEFFVFKKQWFIDNNIKIVYLFDFDEAGYKEFKKLIGNKKINDYKCIVPNSDNISYTMLLSPEDTERCKNPDLDSNQWEIEHLHLFNDKAKYEELKNKPLNNYKNQLHTTIKKNPDEAKLNYDLFNKLFKEIDELVKRGSKI